MSAPPPSGFAPLPDPPYYAVIFTAQRAQADRGYAATADRMSAIAQDNVERHYNRAALTDVTRAGHYPECPVS
ncbi:MAG: hypothetical protein ACNA7Q_05420 [Rhodobacterales bacterium]